MSLLLAFEAAARHESYTRAAVELSLTQSAVSRQVQALEQQLGLTLFRPGGRNYGGFAAPRYGFKPTVMARPVAAG